MIKVEHNPDKLSCKRTLLVRNARSAYHQIQRLTAERQPRGMRVRYMEDRVKNIVNLEARNTLPLDIVERCLREAGMIRRN